MGTKADFYIDNRGDMIWMGSIYERGEPWHMPIPLLAQVNPTMFSEQLSEFLEKIEHMDHDWPWTWEDSRTTDYSYILDCERGQVIGYSSTDRMIFDPLKVACGEDLNSSKIANAIPNFPKLGDGHGQNSSKSL